MLICTALLLSPVSVISGSNYSACVAAFLQLLLIANLFLPHAHFFSLVNNESLLYGLMYPAYVRAEPSLSPAFPRFPRFLYHRFLIFPFLVPPINTSCAVTLDVSFHQPNDCHPPYLYCVCCVNNIRPHAFAHITLQGGVDAPVGTGTGQINTTTSINLARGDPCSLMLLFCVGDAQMLHIRLCIRPIHQSSRLGLPHRAANG